MKARVRIAVIFLIVSCFAKAGANTGSNKIVDLCKELDFEKYYKPCELNFEPNAPGYTLPLDINNIINFRDVGRIMNVNSVSDLIRRNGFAVLRCSGRSGLEEITLDYNSLTNSGIPVFITTDILLHIYHLQFEGMLREMEITQFISDIKNMTSSLLQYNIEFYPQLEGDLKEATRRNIAFLAVARKLIDTDPNSHVPELVDDIVAREVSKIEAHSNFSQSDIFGYNEDYTQYVPRSHYDIYLYPELQCYFKAMM